MDSKEKVSTDGSIGFDEVYLPDETLLNINMEDLFQGRVHGNEEDKESQQRFKVATGSEIKTTIKKRVPANTSANTSFAMKTFYKWAEFRNEQPETALDSMGKVTKI